MAFTPEDGTGLSTANSFCEVAFADTYFADRGNPIEWDELAETEKEFALVKATDFVNLRFNWRGTKGTAEQALEWPRSGAYDDLGRSYTGVPVGLQKAVCEYALRSVTSDLAPDPTYQDTNQLVREKLETVGPITEHVKYADGMPAEPFRAYPSADVLLTPLIATKRFWARG
jgi:hypothetical protein